jgi:hypothetical protein
MVAEYGPGRLVAGRDEHTALRYVDQLLGLGPKVRIEGVRIIEMTPLERIVGACHRRITTRSIRCGRPSPNLGGRSGV